MDRKTARNWYWWLWLSPLLTIPSLLLLYFEDLGFEWICMGGWRSCNWAAAARVTILVAVLGSALWHLILLIPALDKARPFVRWHGRQALLLAGVRTAIPLAFGLGFGDDVEVLLAIPALVLFWFVGTLWGRRQAARGKCSLMRWLGKEDLLLTLREAHVEIQAKEQDAEALIEIIRFSRDPRERRSALAELQKRRMVETL
jgi:hypothetical protein